MVKRINFMLSEIEGERCIVSSDGDIIKLDDKVSRLLWVLDTENFEVIVRKKPPQGGVLEALVRKMSHQINKHRLPFWEVPKFTIPGWPDGIYMEVPLDKVAKSVYIHGIGSHAFWLTSKETEKIWKVRIDEDGSIAFLDYDKVVQALSTDKDESSRATALIWFYLFRDDILPAVERVLRKEGLFSKELSKFMREAVKVLVPHLVLKRLTEEVW